MSCTKCNSERIAMVSGKCSDLCSFSVEDRERDDYVPYGVGIGGGDYIEFAYCLDCGTIHPKDNSTFPVPEAAVDEAFQYDR